MNKKIIALVVSGMAVIGMHNAMAESASNIRFIGAVQASSCDIDTTSLSNVKLPSVTQKDFSSSGISAGEQQFSVRVSGCPNALKTAALKVTGTADKTNSDLLAIDKGDGMAEGIAIELIANGTNTLSVNTGTTLPQPLKNGETTFNLAARYVAVDDVVTAGGVTASAQVGIIYT